MGGVVDKNGQQWERCNECGDYVLIEELWFKTTLEPSTKRIRHLDVCPKCAAVE